MINVLYLQLPSRVKGHITKNEDDSYTIILNSRLSHEQNVRTYKHEISHINNDDFEKSDVNQIERSEKNGKR